MRLIQQMSLHLQLLLLILIPIAGLLMLSAVALQDARSNQAEGQRLAALTKLSVTASALVHELQKERGMNSAFIGSGGREFRRELTLQRRAVDEAALHLRNRLAALREQGVLEQLDEAVKLALRDVDRVQVDYRFQIDSLEITEPDALGSYTAVNVKLINLSSLLATESQLSFINNPAVAYTSFMKSKERAGIERSLLASTFASGSFAQDARLALNTLITEQDAFLDIFLTFSDPATRERYASMIASPVFDKTFAYRSIAISHADDGEFGVTVGDWYRDQTAKIDALKAFEDSLAKNLITLAETHAAQTRHYATWLLLMTLAIMVLAKLANRLVRRTLLARLGTDPRELSAIARRIAAHDFSTDFEQYNCKSGSVVGDMKTMQALLIKREQASQQDEDEQHKLAANGDSVVYLNALQNRRKKH